MKKILLFLVALFCLFGTDLSAQECGTQHVPQPRAYLEAFEAYQNQPDFRNERELIGVTVFIIEPTAGASSLSIEVIENEIKRVNAIFFGSGIEFFLCGNQRVVLGQSMYNYTSSDNLNRSLRVENTVNIFYVDDVQRNDGTSLCGFAFYPWALEKEDRYVMMSKDCADNGATLAHELGHFFGLLHTHDTFGGIELVDGSNCSSAGDFLCDTPADPLLGGFNIDRNCVYQGTITDPNGRPYAPSSNNIMSYAPSTCRRLITQDQAARVRFFNDTDNSYLINECDFYPDYAVDFDGPSSLNVTGGQQLDMKVNLEKTNIQAEETLDVYFYLSEDPEERGIPFKRESLVVTPGEETVVLDFELELPINRASGNYFLSMVFDATFKVIEQTKKNNISAIGINIDNTKLGEARLFPNPAGNDLKVFIKDKNLRNKIRGQIFSVTGQLLYEFESFKTNEEYLDRFDISELPDGLYIMSLYFIVNEERRSFKFLKKT